MFLFKEAFCAFFRKHPALMSGVVCLLGMAYGLNSHLVYLLLFGLLSFPLWIRPIQSKLLAVCVLIFVSAFTLVSLRCPIHTLPQETMKGKGVFTISNLKPQQSPFHRSLVYRGTLNFESEDGFKATQLPCAIYHPAFGKHPQANCAYEIEGTLIQKQERFFIFKPEKKKAWNAVPGSFSLAEWRYQAKQAFNQFLKHHIQDSHTRIFLNALSSGEVDDRILSLEFGKLGMQHILAISGFHFALIALFLGTLLRLIFPFYYSTILLLILLSAYCFFLGYSPSVFRAYTAICVLLVGSLFGRRTSALNALGVGLLLELLIDPLVITHTGFQLSFLCTLAILLLTAPCCSLLEILLPRRSFTELLEMPRLDQHGYLLASFFRNSLSVNLAVLFASLPVLLLLFNRFPLLSIIYNLFFPLCISLSMLLLCIGCLLSLLIPTLGTWVHSINNSWTSAVLTLSSEPPAFCDFVLRMKGLPFTLVAVYLTLLFIWAIYWDEKRKTELF